MQIVHMPYYYTFDGKGAPNNTPCMVVKCGNINYVCIYLKNVELDEHVMNETCSFNLEAHNINVLHAKVSLKHTQQNISKNKYIFYYLIRYIFQPEGSPLYP